MYAHMQQKGEIFFKGEGGERQFGDEAVLS